jgi:T4 RnlA family RNA ligase
MVSRPFEKFFNMHEITNDLNTLATCLIARGELSLDVRTLERKYDSLVDAHGLEALREVFPFTNTIELSTIVEVLDKMDGSLISTMDTSGADSTEFWLKSKGSLSSTQAVESNVLIRTPKYAELYQFCVRCVDDGLTVIMEYTGPSNRIVLSYDDHGLTVLAVRDNESGVYVPLETYADSYPNVPFVKNHVTDIDDVEAFALSVDDMVDIEGYVFQLASGHRFKVKTEYYKVLHHIKDSINSQRRLFEAVVYETSDDVKASFFDDPIAIALIEDMEEKVFGIYNHMVEVVESYHRNNKHMNQKDYAIKGQQELNKIHFGLAMSKYIGREVDYKATMVKRRKDYGIMDDPT